MSNSQYPYPDEYFEIDWGGRRFTHHPSGDTLLRHEWMVKHTGHAQWKEHFQAFIARHPDATVMINDHEGVIDDLRRWPLAGGDYSVGEKVICRLPSKGHWDAIRTIVKKIDAPNEHRDSVLQIDHNFELDNGEALYWSYMDDAWQTKNSDGDIRMRVRPSCEADILAA